MKRRKLGRRLAMVAVVLAVAALLFFRTFWGDPLPSPPALTGELPAASPPAGMEIFQLPTGVTHRSAAFAYRGGSFGDHRDFTMTAVLVKHPRGDILIDTGFGKDIAAHLLSMPAWFRAMTSYERSSSAAEQLDRVGYDRTKLHGILLTHAHWDHVSGVPELAGTPIMVDAEEHRFIEHGGWLTALVRSFSARYEEYAFEGGPYLGFTKSHDVYGDGAIVVVPAPGHTPGSVVVFVTLPGGKRYGFVGDLCWQREGITEREERPWLQRTLGDDDEEGVRENLLRMSAIASRFPEITLVPAHDARGFADMPRFSP